MAWGEWCDLARIVAGGVEKKAGNDAAATALWAPVERRITQQTPPTYVFRAKIATWEQVHRVPAFERILLTRLGKNAPQPSSAGTP
jgi:hypothetical protein